MAGHSGGCPSSLVKALQAARLGPCSCRGAVGGDAPPHGSLPDIRVRAPSRSPAMGPWRYLPRAHCNRHMQSACCSGRNYLRDQLREMEVRTASSGARAYCTTSVLQHHDAVGVRVTRRTPEAAASWPNRRSCVAAAAGMALGPPTTPQLPSSGSRGSQRIWAREIPTRLLLLLLA